MSDITGRCRCGGVRFRITRPVTGAILCHCRDCQQMHGNYNAMAAAPRDAVIFEADATLAWYASSDKARRGFCTTCGGRLFKDNLGSDRLMVSMGVLDPPTGLHVMKNIWTQSKGDWYDLPAEVPPAA